MVSVDNFMPQELLSDEGEESLREFLQDARVSRSRADIEERTMMPIGSVASARQNGAMGLVQAGSETNALDIISDQGS